ncbi:MAG: hypothetical protein WCI18_08620 [Pseudomonadota bacterium]
MKNFKMTTSIFLAAGLVVLHVSCADPKSLSIESKSSSVSTEVSQDEYVGDQNAINSALKKLDLAEADLKNEPGAADIVSTDVEDFLASKEPGAALATPSSPIDAKDDKDAKDAKDALQEARKFQQLLLGNEKIIDFSKVRDLIKDIAKSLKGPELSAKIDETLKSTLESLEKQKSAIKAARDLNKETVAKIQDLKMNVLKNCLSAKGLLGDKGAFFDQLCKVVPKLALCSKLGELKIAVGDKNACEKSISDLKAFVKVSVDSLKAPVAP